jgi:hypothetical protein
LPSKGFSSPDCGSNKDIQAAMKDGLRPQPPNLESLMVQLITRCWDADPARRRSFEDIDAQFVSQAVSFPMAKPGATAPLHEVRGPISCSREQMLQLRKQRGEAAELQMELALAARQRFLKT